MSSYTSISIDSNTNSSPSEIELPENEEPTILTSSEDVYFQSLLDILRNGNDEDFLINYSLNDSLKNYNDIQIKLLTEAIVKHKSRDIIEQILCNMTTIDYNLTIREICLAENVEAFETLLRLDCLNVHRMVNTLTVIIFYLNEELFDKWFDYFLEAVDKFDVNANDQQSLRSAYFVEKKKVVRKLLEVGAYIGATIYFQNIYSGKFHLILKPQDIRECFDSCIHHEKLSDLSSYMSFNYKNLVPPQSNPDLNEMIAIMQIINSKEHLDLLQHPLITSFMDIKWKQISKFVYLNFFLYWFYLASIVSYIILTTGNETESGFTKLTWWITIFGTIYLIVREAKQLRHPKEYLKKPRTYLELLLIIFSILIITIPYKEIIVIGILLIALEFWILVRNLPIFSTHILMLEVVLKTFIKSFSLYSIFVFTFALCFFVKFGPERKFENIFKSVVRTMAMVVGELNFNDLDLEGFWSYTLMLLFIICMAVILMNLLNGLAFSEIQQIRQQAEFNGLICRAKFLNNHDYKLFPNDDKINQRANPDDRPCDCKFYVYGVYLCNEVFSNKEYLPLKCLYCYINDGDNIHTNREQWTWFGFLKEKVLETFDFWMGNRTVIESSIIEAKTITMNKENATIKEEKKQLEKLEEKTMKNNILHIQDHSHNIERKVTITENRAYNIEKDVYNTYFKSIINEQSVQNIENKVKNIEKKGANMEKNILNICQKSVITEQNVQNIDNKVKNIEQRVENIEREQQNIGKNVEKILNSIQLLCEKNYPIINNSQT